MRIARVVVPGVPHHIIQRGSRDQSTFFREADYQKYISLMKQWCQEGGVDIWAYCLMRNRVHLIAVPETKNSFRLGIGEAHRRYTRYINQRKKWRGHLWQERFHSCPMDETHLYEAVRYVERTPVRDSVVIDPGEYAWSSAQAHLEGKNDELVNVAPMITRVHNWEGYLADSVEGQVIEQIEIHTRTGRPLGNDEFLRTLEEETGRILRAKSHGRPRRKS